MAERAVGAGGPSRPGRVQSASAADRTTLVTVTVSASHGCTRPPNPLACGPLTQSERLPPSATTPAPARWEVAARDLAPDEMRIGESRRAAVAVLVDHAGGAAGHPSVGPTIAGAVQNVLETLASTAAAPVPLIIRTGPAWRSEVEAAAARLPASVVVEPPSDAALDALDSLSAQLAGRPEAERPPARDDWVLLHEAARLFLEVKPWEERTESEPLVLDLRAGAVRGDFIGVVLGGGESPRGVLLLPGRDVEAALRRLAARDLLAGSLTLHFEGDERPGWEVERIRRLGWPAGIAVLPRALGHDSQGPREIDRHAAQMLTVGLRAITALTTARGQRIELTADVALGGGGHGEYRVRDSTSVAGVLPLVREPAAAAAGDASGQTLGEVFRDILADCRLGLRRDGGVAAEMVASLALAAFEADGADVAAAASEFTAWLEYRAGPESFALLTALAVLAPEPAAGEAAAAADRVRGRRKAGRWASLAPQSVVIRSAWRAADRNGDFDTVVLEFAGGGTADHCLIAVSDRNHDSATADLVLLPTLAPRTDLHEARSLQVAEAAGAVMASVDLALAAPVGVGHPVWHGLIPLVRRRLGAHPPVPIPVERAEVSDEAVAAAAGELAGADPRLAREVVAALLRIRAAHGDGDIARWTPAVAAAMARWDAAGLRALPRRELRLALRALVRAWVERSGAGEELRRAGEEAVEAALKELEPRSGRATAGS